MYYSKPAIASESFRTVKLTYVASFSIKTCLDRSLATDTKGT